MAFPGTYNFNYYKGDTFEFRVYPKDSAGGTFPLSDYSEGLGVTKFTIAPSRGVTSGLIQGYAEISNDKTYILCVVTPANGAVMTAGTTYVYDVEIARTSASYDFVYTLLTGNITVSEQVTQPGELSLPSNPTDLTVSALTSDSISVGWTAPTTGGDPDGYKIYVLPYTIDPATILAKLGAGPDYTVDAETTSYTTTGLTPSTEYLIGIRSYNVVGDAPAFEGLTPLILSNLGVPITTLPEVP
jgi:hypothetical protein